MTLTQIAFLLRREARSSGRARHTLKRKLTLTLTKKGPEWTLSLTRPDVPPSEREVAICRVRFDVPENAKQESTTVGGYHIVRLSWTETLIQTSFAPAEPPANPYKYD